MKPHDEKGFALFLVMMFFLTAALGLSSLGWMGGSQARNADHNVKSAQSFYLMEAAVEKAKAVLNNNFFATANGVASQVSLGDGKYYYNIEADPGNNAYIRKITGYGAVPDFDDPQSTRAVEVFVQGDGTLDVPSNFDDYVLWTAGSARFNGNSYRVTGSIIVGGSITRQHDKISGSEVVDATINPLLQLDFDALKAIAQSQTYDGHDNYYTAAEIASGQSKPTTFYYTAPNEAYPEGVPHIVYCEDTVSTSSNLGGFIIVVGASPTTDTKDFTVNGNVSVQGVVYCRGMFTINGGGNAQNIDGAVFSGSVATMNGGITMRHNQAYLDAVEAIKTGSGNMTVLSWNEIEF